nr:DUF839 domain-containing protein [Chloroflexota bacterium]
VQRGAFVSSFRFGADGTPLSGERAYDTVVEHVYAADGSDDPITYAPAEVGNATRGFARFCSGYLSLTDGLDRPIYFTNEESDGSDTFDGKGGLSVAIFENELHTLPHLGRMAKENTLVMRQTGNRTVVITMEDGPASLNNQFWMYVGKKDPNASDPLARNGLNNGTLYVARSLDLTRNSEATFRSGVVDLEWVPIEGAESMSAAQLETAADAVNAMTFVRPEDGAFDKQFKNLFYWVTTGGMPGVNALGRLYTLRLNPGNVLQTAQLQLIYDADVTGDTAISPDNLDASADYLMINEDGTTQSRVVMGQRDRDGSIWRFPLRSGHWTDRVDVGARDRVVELDPPANAETVLPGVWETSGIIDTSTIWGPDSWLFDVQAHIPTAAPNPATQVEDGQLLLMTPAD